MFDASVKSPVGVEYGVEYQFGNFDQCLDISTNVVADIKSKYCLVDVTLKGYQVRKTAERFHEVSWMTIALIFIEFFKKDLEWVSTISNVTFFIEKKSAKNCQRTKLRNLIYHLKVLALDVPSNNVVHEFEILRLLLSDNHNTICYPKVLNQICP